MNTRLGLQIMVWPEMSVGLVLHMTAWPRQLRKMPDIKSYKGYGD